MVAKRTTGTWLASLEPPLRPIAESLRRLILDADPELSESIKWGNPTFEKGSKVCYLAATKAYVSLGFFNGAALTDAEGVLEGTGKKMRHVKVRDLSHIRNELLSSWIRQAIDLNQQSRPASHGLG